MSNDVSRFRVFPPECSDLVRYSYMNAEKYNLERIYFGGCFIRGESERRARKLIAVADGFIGHAATIGTLSYAIRFWSKGEKRALFLRHEGFLYVPSELLF